MPFLAPTNKSSTLCPSGYVAFPHELSSYDGLGLLGGLFKAEFYIGSFSQFESYFPSPFSCIQPPLDRLNSLLTLSHPCVIQNPTTGKTTSSLYSGTTAITQPGVGRDFSPFFNPADPNVVFYMSTGTNGVSNIWVKSLTDANAAPYAVTNFPIDISNVRMAPTYFVFTAEVYDTCGIDFACTAQLDATAEGNPNRGIVFDSLFVRHWDHIVTPGKSSQLFSLQIQTSNGKYIIPSRAKITPLSQSVGKLNVPVPPDGGIEQIALHPDYKYVAFTGALIAHDSAWTTGWRTYQVAVNWITGEPIDSVSCITCEHFPGIRTTMPKYDASGDFLAVLVMDRPGFEADRLHLVSYKTESWGTPPAPISNSLDRSIIDYAWTTDGKTILATFDEDGDERLYSINIAANSIKPIALNGSNAGIKVQNEAVYYTHNSYNEPADIRSFAWDPQALAPVFNSARRVTNLNPSIAQFGLPTGSKFYFTSPADGTRVQGWFFTPKGFNPNSAKQWPFVLLIHGGPQGAWNSAWSYRWNPQLWAERGYAVALINPHGSTGFGQNFTDGVSGNWGGVPFHDLMAGLDYVLQQNSWIDSTRLSACGASYGGFMINWLQGNAPTRFSSLVVHDGLFDVPISYGATDELWFPEWEFKGTPWTNSTGYSVWNPARFADKWQTPMLVVHGGKDYRVDLAHGLAAFSTLQRKNIPSKFLFYPEENHWVTRPVNSIQWYREVLSWLDRYTKRQ